MNRIFGKSDEVPSLSLSPLSLLSPTPPAERQPIEPAAWEADLGLSDLVDVLASSRRYRKGVREVLVGLSTDADVIRWRQGVLADMVANPELVAALDDILPHIAGLSERGGMLGKRTRSLLMETADRLAELDLYCELLLALGEALDAATLTSKALIDLRYDLRRLTTLPAFAGLRAELPRLRAPLQNIGSLTVGINLDYNLNPRSAVLIAINGREIGEPQSLLDKLFNNPDEDPKERQPRGIAPVHAFSPDREKRRYDELFQDVDRLMQQTAKPIADSLRAYVRTNSEPLVQLEGEIAFFVAAARMIERAGVEFCRPEVAPADERVMTASGLRNIALVLRDEATAVPSDVRFDDEGRVAVLTGPNSGGKTTFLRNIGLAQVMAQAGLFLPAAAARVSPVDTIATHFPRLETREEGRLAEEAARLRDVFTKTSGHSLVLLNETFSSTAFGEALYLAQDVLGAMCAIGVRAVFATHLVELAEHFDVVHAAVEPRSLLFSLVAGIKLDENGKPVPTYQITRGEPLGRSYAQEIARRHGISLAQIMAARETGSV
jgi:DNA mismatch repair protein MutS